MRIDNRSLLKMLNGHNGGDASSATLSWSVGLLNGAHKYLTAETFGFKVNANGAALKKKQLWTLEPCCVPGEDQAAVRLRSHLGRYLAVDQFGNVTCEDEEAGEGSRFHITVSGDSRGQWALRNSNRGYFLGASGDQLVCVAKAPGSAELWTVHLAARPQVTIRSAGRRRFARLSSAGDEIQVDAATPWGEDTLFTLEFRDGRYALHTGNDRYLAPDGKLLETCAPECLFSLEFHSGYLALRDLNLRYLSPIGSKAVMRTRSNSVTRDELFSLEDSVPQAAFVGFNGKYVSVKQGVDVTANQDEVSDHETFQLEWDKGTGRWLVRTMQDKYWTLESSSGIQANADKGSSNCLFELCWQADGSLTLVANNGKLVGAKKSGHLFANCEAGDPAAKFHFALVNRPVLVLRCDQGFVGRKGPSSPKLECNRASYEVVHVERGDRGVCLLKGNNGKYWGVAEDGSVSVDADDCRGFYVELREPSRLCLKTADGSYLNADKNGAFKAGAADPEQATLWEY
ncbi:protein singed isoform X1 [Ixodes scapularis]|nr:protein singed isoform X1 [Ixodes scapularis]